MNYVFGALKTNTYRNEEVSRQQYLGRRVRIVSLSLSLSRLAAPNDPSLLILIARLESAGRGRTGSVAWALHVRSTSSGEERNDFVV